MVDMEKGKIFNILEVILKEKNKNVDFKKKLNYYYRFFRIFIIKTVTIEFMEFNC